MLKKPTALCAIALSSVLALSGCSVPGGESAQGTSSSDGASQQAQAGTYRQATPEEAQEIMESGEDVVVVDVRTQEEYDTGHIPGAICVPNETIEEEAAEALPDKEQTILVYCRSGNRSKQASEKLAAMGYANVVEFGGIADWPGDVVVD